MANSDYKKSRININDLLPEVFRSPVNLSLNENLFNRFLSKSEIKNINGIAGVLNPNNNVPIIKEANEFLQKYQLQPIIYNKIGTVDYILTFQNFIKTLENLGVDIDNYDKWGALTKFNWVPPIDFDKLINFQDYLWDNSVEVTIPEYITIKNQNNWVDARFEKLKESIAEISLSFKVVLTDISNNIISIAGNKVNDFITNEKIIAKDKNNNYYFLTPSSIIFNTSSLRTDIIVQENIVDFVNIYKTILKISGINLANNSISIQNDLTKIFNNSYVFLALNSLTNEDTFFKVKSSIFDSTSIKTEIILEQPISNLFDWKHISLLPILESTKSEKIVTLDNAISQFITNWTNDKIGDLIWYKNYSVLEEKLSGSTTIRSNIFTDLSVNFPINGVKSGDFIIITHESNQIEEFLIMSVGENSLNLNKNNFFTKNDIKYKIIRKNSFKNIISDIEPINPILFQFWVDTNTDKLKQWNGSQWIILLSNFSLFYNILNKRYELNLVQNNDWSKQNKWIHKNNVTSFTNMVKAQQPIIEYFPYMEMSETSFAFKSWSYRIDSNSNYIQSEIQPKLFELIDIRLQSVIDPEIKFIDNKTIILNEKFGNLSKDIKSGENIQLKNFVTNNGLYEVEKIEFLQFLPNTRYVTKISLVEELVDINDLPQNSNIIPDKTSFGDPFKGIEENHWLFNGITDIKSSSILPVINPMLSETVSDRTFYTNDWVGTTFYNQDDIVVNDDSKVYIALNNGISDETGGPTGFGFNIVDNTVNWRFIGHNYNYILGLITQDINFISSGNITNTTIFLDPSLHDLCLYEDYQEGDIRIYIDGIRQYGNFSELRSEIDPNFIGGIKFDNLTLSNKNIIRIELGEYANDDIGKRAVNILTAAGIELNNLVDLRKIEQQKEELAQYPYFNVFDIFRNASKFASRLFSYNESENSPINIPTLRRLEFNAETRDYGFNQELLDKNNQLLLYKDFIEVDNVFQSIWRKGLNNEKYIPKKLSNGDWELSDTWYFNLTHKNNEHIFLSEIFSHFSSIIKQQTISSIFSSTNSSLYYIDDNINYGVGGTIHEYDAGLDLLVSACFINNLNIINLIQFAHDQYLNDLTFIKEKLEESIINFLIDSNITDNKILLSTLSEFIRDSFEDNDKLDQYFGDSSTYDEVNDIGVKNWIATLPYFNLFPKYNPYLIIDENINLIQLFHHDGHRSDINYSKATKEQLYIKLSKSTIVGEQTVKSTNEPFSLVVNNEVQVPKFGDFLIRNDLEKETRKLYKFNIFFIWEEINIDVILGNIILDFEKSLFSYAPISSSINNFITSYDITKNYNNPLYNSLSLEQFSNFLLKNDIDLPFLSTFFYKSNDPYTWNYQFTPIQTHPLTNQPFDDVVSYSFALYNKIYNTPYPHREPWFLQGYNEKPDWWDETYLDPSGSRFWRQRMWNNVMNGIIPIGRKTPTGVDGTGFAGQINKIYSYVSVNIDSISTNDGILPDGLLPPFWDTRNTTNSDVRSLYDPKQHEFIITPQANYNFGNDGPNEWEWKISAQRKYDDLIIAFKLDPIIFNSKTFGNKLVDINGLSVDTNIQKVFSHSDTKFHGDFIDDKPVKFDGFNQWYVHYNRYNGFDGINSGFRSQWIDWDIFLSYNFSSFIDTSNFSVSNDFFDISTKDYQILINNSKNIENKSIDAIKIKVLDVPSKFIENRQNSLDWLTELNTTSPVTNIVKSYDVQNYDFISTNLEENIFKIFNYNLINADIDDINGYQIISYNQKILPEFLTNLRNDNFTYKFRIKIDDLSFKLFAIKGKLIQTFNDLLSELNTLFDGDALAFIEDGNIKIQSNTVGLNSRIEIIDDGLFVSATTQLDSNDIPIPIFNSISDSLQSTIIFNNIFFIENNKTNLFSINSIFSIYNSTNFNGVYTVVDSIYDSNLRQTKIFVKSNDIILNNNIIDGIIELNNKTFPNEWETGIEVNISSSKFLPLPLDKNLYFFIKLSETEFKLAETKELAENNIAIDITSIGSGELKIGRLESTFSVDLKNQTIFFNRFFSDKRNVSKLICPLLISGIQNVIDIIKGYEDYTFDQGFIVTSSDRENIDEEGKPNSWLSEVEKFIKKLYLIQSIKTSDTQEYLAKANKDSSSFILENDYNLNWKTGTQVVIFAEGKNKLPKEFDNPLTESIIYYIIPSLQKNIFQLASSFNNSKNGIPIKFTDNGIGTINVKIYINVQNLPIIELNPFKNYISISNTKGILSNIFDSSNLDLISKQFIYDNNQNRLSVSDLMVLREDKFTKISLLGKQKDINLKFIKKQKYIQGMKLFYDGFDNILIFNSYSTDNVLIYDSFLGIATPRFYLNFNRNPEITFRPNVGGFVLSDGKLINNFESNTENLRYLYDFYNKNQSKNSKDLIRKSLGYDGPKDYMNDLRIDEDAQFIFWRSMIQNKGTNFSLNAFINQDVFDNLIVDEFYAYKLATFGDNKERNYIDLKLQVDDVSNKELRLEFVVPDGNALDSTFRSIRLTDFNRFFDQPDQLLKFSPIKTFYFNTKVVSFIEDVQNKIQVVNGKNIFILPKLGEGIVISFYDNLEKKRKLLQENIDYEYFNITAINFLNNITTLNSVQVAILSYDYDAQNPAKIIDKKAKTVIKNIPIFNPAFGQYYYNAFGIIDIKSNQDPAKYNNSLIEVSENFWNFKEIGKIWFDDQIEGYFPYYDKYVFKDLNERLLRYGKLADWADIKLYEWIESDVSPIDWDQAVINDSQNNDILSKNKKTGTPLKNLYKNISNSWIEENDQHYETTADLLSLNPINIQFKSDEDNIVKIYKNGSFLQNLNLGSIAVAENNLIVFIANQPINSYIHVILPAHVPTQQELDTNLYKFDTPFSKIAVSNKDTGLEETKYYFWITQKSNRPSFSNKISIFEAEKLLKNMIDPYMIITGFRGIDFGYGLIYGNVFDENSFDVPFRFVQAIVRGIAGLVTDENRFSLRFTRDFALRDKLPDNETLNDIHTEWVLFREKQTFKIDIYLWEKLIEALINRTLVNKQATDVIVPAVERILFDDLFDGETKYGLNEGQVFTDKQISLKTINNILNDSNINFGNINIENFLETHSFNTINDTIKTMYDIYNNFPVSAVNYIYFRCLNDALSLKREYAEFIKTSWVGIQISQNI